MSINTDLGKLPVVTDFANEAVTQTGQSLKFASEELKNDQGVVAAALAAAGTSQVTIENTDIKC